ncbi:T9SS type A sorting domain-containing protein [Flavobacterium sp. F372]|uniref:T9SS type A sorting domain-containing protein n=1 Tax=Flavobacterium bernardetii TaxID=2813823 RepID=A0ABR7IWT3_9FLAO|nr:choice-of-anchor J domain-containing protein [Flavobacterium bernardetii]MBC5834223.1 T9SS type A sorting domain-containing protein [Flavobacterium bernardetii]NHF70138.1 T9SS type A sorting domain-containing protein [Flavobacterium bernardetii]
MKKITLWLFALFTCWQMSAQTGTVVVGVDDGTPNASWEDPSPLQDNYKTQRIQILYTAAEMTGAGLVAGPITEIGWVATALNTSTLQENYKISMMSTASTVLTGTFVSGATVVYGPADFTPSATGNVMFTLTTPFVWDGTSNVIIELCAGLASGAWTSNVSCANSTTSDVKTVYYRNDSAVAPCTQATGTTTTTRPILVAVGNVASCLAPLNLVSANITAYTADVSWDASSSASAVGYQYVVSTSNIAPAGSGTPTSNLYASVSSLLPQTVYYLFVKTDCGGTFSGWNGPVSFTTACAPITTLPHLENFNTFLPNQCWSQGDGGDLTAGPATFGPNGWQVDGLGNVGTTGAFKYNVFVASANDWVISPQFTIPATGYELKFDAAAVQYGGTNAPTTPWESDDSIEVLVSSTGTTNWTLLHAYTDANQPGNTAISLAIDLDAYASQTVRFAYRAVEGTADGAADIDFSIDNFQVRLSPICPDQTGLVVSNITSSGADTSWDDMAAGGSIGYEYAVTTSATPPVSGTPTTALFYIASGLSSQTVYYLHVRSTCAGSTFGNWTSKMFTTACAPVTGFNENFDSVTTPILANCWSKIISGATVSTFASVGTVNFVSASAPNSVDMYNSSSAATDNIMLVSPMLTNLSAGTHRLKFNARNNSATQDLEIGVLTDPTDASTFTLVQAVDITTTFQSYTVNFDTFTGPGSVIAFRRLSTSTYTNVYVDDVVWELMPTCPDQTGLVVSNITSSGADTSWDTIAAGVEYAITTSATPPASGTPTTATFYIASGLTPQTVYYLHVRTDCGAGSFGVWVSIPFTTQCAPITTLPWVENFDAVTVPAFPSCWSEENGDWQTSNATTYNTPRSGANYLRDAYGATNEFMWTPAFNLVAGTSYDFSSWIQGDGDTTWTVDFYVNNAQNSTGATQLGPQYVVPGTGTIELQPYAQATRTFVPVTSGTYYFAYRVNEPTFGPWYVAIDDVELKLSPSTLPVCATNLVATPNACGNFSNNLTWNVEPAATGYYITIGTTSGGTDVANAVNVSSNSYSFSGTIGTTYFWKVVPYNAAGPATGCLEQSFITSATGCYCTSVPTSVDNSGITSAVVGATTNPISVVTYTNLTAVSEIVAPGANTNVQLTFSTGYDYDVNIWIDFNNDFDFDDAGELVKTGIACTTAQPNTVDASFIMPLTAPSGTHRMRIGTADTGQAVPNPCYSGSWGVTLDFTVDTTLGVNSFDKNSFVAYPNPVKDVLNLSYKTEISNVRVVNLLGQEVLNSKTNSNDVQVDMSTLTSGAYVVNITVEDTVHTIKVIKE